MAAGRRATMVSFCNVHCLNTCDFIGPSFSLCVGRVQSVVTLSAMVSEVDDVVEEAARTVRARNALHASIHGVTSPGSRGV